MNTRKRPRKLRFETLEARDVPTAYHWTGADPSPNWNDQDNWINETTNSVSGFPSVVDDVAKFLNGPGDVVIIPDGARLTTGRLLFDDPDDPYTITNLGTGSLTLDVSSGETAVTVSRGNHVLGMSVELADSITFDVADGAALNTVGAFTVGFGSLVNARKLGPGTLHVAGSGSNDFSNFFVQNGVVELAKPSGEVVTDNGVINVGDGAGEGGSAVVRALSSDDIDDAARVIVGGDGLLDLNGFNDTIGSLQLLANVDKAAVVSTGAGTLRLGTSIEAKTANVGLPPVISGRLDLPTGTHVFDVDPGLTLDINAAISGTGGINKKAAGTLRLGGDSTLAGPINVNEGLLIVDGVLSNAPVAVGAGRLGGSGSVKEISVTSPSAVVAPGNGGSAVLTSTNGVTLGNGVVLELDIRGADPGAGHDQLEVDGGVTLANATLLLTGGNVIVPPEGLVIISNDGSDAVNGQFAGVPDGGIVTADGQPFTIDYGGGDGNDVALLPLPLKVTVAADGKSATYVDIDGDLVTVRTSAGKFDGSEFIGVTTGANDAGQLQKLKLDSDFSGGNISVTGRRTANGGNGFVNVGFIDGGSVDLGKVTVRGDVGRINAGTVGGDPKVPAIKSLAVQSVGLLDTTTQLPGGNLASNLTGALPRLTVFGDFRGNLSLVGGTDARLGTVTIGGSFVSPSGPRLFLSQGGIGSLRIGGDLRAAVGSGLVISTQGAIGSVYVGGSILGSSTGPGAQINANGQLAPPPTGLDLAIKSLTVRGSVEYARITAGLVSPVLNPDASIGTITVGGDWIASSVSTATSAGGDLQIGTDDDFKLTGAGDDPGVPATIGRITIKGQALGTAGIDADMFGIVAERIDRAKIGGRTFNFTPAGKEGFFAAPTGPGFLTLSFDFTIREIGSSTPNITVTPDLTISGDGRTATFNDVDGDLVIVKRSQGTFVQENFDFGSTATGLGLKGLVFGLLAPVTDGTDLTITARPGPLGGNGWINVGTINALGVDLGAVRVAGDLAAVVAGNSDFSTPGVKSVEVHSIGQLNTSGAPGDVYQIQGALSKLNVATDVRFATVAVFSDVAPAIGQAVIGGSLIGSSSLSSGRISAARGIGSLRIGGDVRSGSGALSGRIECSDGSIGRLSIGGDIVGTTSVPVVISADGQSTPPAKGPDVAIGSVAVKGGVEYANIIGGGDTNADASIGTVSVGRDWLASNLVAGVSGGDDGVFGTSDDAKLSGLGITDNTAIKSAIGSIRIRGQASGSATGGDHFGIVAESVGLVSISGVVSLTTKDKDTFNLGTTGDFTVNEV